METTSGTIALRVYQKRPDSDLDDESVRYHHSPLNDPDEIRLVEILPGGWDEEIVCQMDIARLGNAPEYDALSYT